MAKLGYLGARLLLAYMDAQAQRDVIQPKDGEVPDKDLEAYAKARCTKDAPDEKKK